LATVAEGDDKIGEPAGVADHFQMKIGQALPSLVIPKVLGCHGRPPHPAQLFARRHLLDCEVGLAKNWHGRSVAPAVDGRETIEQ
jgi:hypothetical protein